MKLTVTDCSNALTFLSESRQPTSSQLSLEEDLLDIFGRMVGSIRNFDSKDGEDDWIRELMDLALGKLYAYT